VTSWILGVRLDDVPTEQRLRELCEGFLDGERTMRIFTPNPEILLRAREDPEYAQVLNSADLALPDGTGVALIESLRSRHRVRRWPGVEIGTLLLRIAAERGATVAFVGGSAKAAEAAAARWRRALPGVRIETAGDGVPVAEDGAARPDERDLELSRAVASLAPTIVLVGLGAPKQERWIARNAGALPSTRILMGIGGAFDMWAGHLRRAPRPIRGMGLEWAWRLVLEPRRWLRILRATIVFPVRALTDPGNRIAPPPSSSHGAGR
jgi:N-acetylglucosaminyldiphosphoundecaprenol N-acetyl-beta-D-mannosaminyltransferase